MGTSKNSLEFRLEKDIVDFLITKLEHHELSLDRASQIAKFILAHLPENLTDEQVKQILPSLDDKFIELADIVYKHINSYDDTHKEQTINDIRELIRHAHFEQVSKLTSEYFNKKYPPSS